MTQVMTEKTVKKATTATEIAACYPVMHQLRPHLTDREAFVKQVQRQQQQGYHLAYLERDGEIVAVTGYRFLEFLAWGKVLYIDDLISNAETRKSGHGNYLLQWVIDQAKAAKCDQVHLDSGPQRHDAHRLYLKAGFKIIGYHFALEIQ